MTQFVCGRLTIVASDVLEETELAHRVWPELIRVAGVAEECASALENVAVRSLDDRSMS